MGVGEGEGEGEGEREREAAQLRGFPYNINFSKLHGLNSTTIIIMSTQ